MEHVDSTRTPRSGGPCGLVRMYMASCAFGASVASFTLALAAESVVADCPTWMTEAHVGRSAAALDRGKASKTRFASSTVGRARGDVLALDDFERSRVAAARYSQGMYTSGRICILDFTMPSPSHASNGPFT